MPHKTTYKVRGEPISKHNELSFLKIDPETSKVVKAKPVRLDTSRRVARLHIFDRSGDGDQIIKTIISGGVHRPSGKTIVTRKRFFEIIDRISENNDLVRDIIKEWHRQTKYYVDGGMEELKAKHPSPYLFQELCDPSDILEASRISSRMHNEIVGQIVYEFAD